MKAPRHYRITIIGDAERIRGQFDRRGLLYLVDRLLAGETVADSEWQHYGLTVVADHNRDVIDDGVAF